MANDETSINFSFAGCGFLGIYHIGVTSALRQYAPNLVTHRVTGASAGAIAACSLISDVCLGQVTSEILNIVCQARQRALGPLHPSFDLVEILRQGLYRNLPSDAHITASNRLFVSLTRFSDGKNVLVSQFDSKEELVQAIICSTFIPFYCGLVPPLFRGERYIDGGWSDNQPRLDGNTVTVSPFSGESDICPLDTDSQSFLSFDMRNTNVRLTARNAYRFSIFLFPAHPEIMSQMCREGFEDALRFLARHDLISCARCLEIRSSILVEGCECDSGLNHCEMHDPEPDVDLAVACNNGGAGNKRVKFEDCNGQTSENDGVKRLKNVRSLGKLIDDEEPKPDCETCTAFKRVASTNGLPAVVKQTLADAIAFEQSFLKCLTDMKLIKLLWFITAAMVLPLDIFIMLSGKVINCMLTLPRNATWFVSNLISGLNFFFESLEAYHRKRKCRLICNMSVTDLSYASSVPYETMKSRSVTGRAYSIRSVCGRKHMSEKLFRRRYSLGSLMHPLVDSKGRYTIKNCHFGMNVDLPNTAAAGTARHLKHVVHRRLNADQSGLTNAQVTREAEKLELEGLKQALSSPDEVPSGARCHESLDTYADVLNFTRKNEALMTYYYMDEENDKRIRVTKIFGTKTSLSDNNQQNLTNVFPAKRPGGPNIRTKDRFNKAVAIITPFQQDITAS